MEETNLYRVHIVNNKAAAIVRAEEAGVNLAMIDFALGDEWVQDIESAAHRSTRHQTDHSLRREPDSPTFDGLRPWTLARKPFDMSDFMDAVSHNPSTSTGETALLPWLSDENKAAQHLTRITLESSAQAALITRKNQMWAYAGGLATKRCKGNRPDCYKELGRAKRIGPVALHSA